MARALTRSLRRRCGGQAGYSLVEMITVMVILGIVLSGLTTMFHAGMTAEVRANRELQAQQNARAALDRIRRELHCASGIVALSGVPVASVTVTLPPACPGSDTIVTYATSAVAANRWKLTRTPLAGTATTVADYLTSATIFTYYAPGIGTLGRLEVDIPVNLNPADAGTLWRLQDDVVLRNTIRL